MAASGFAGLGYQIVWTQQCALWLGHEAAAVLAVVAAFFGGLALGALVLGSRIERSTQATRWYAGCEFVIALWGLLLTLLMAPFGNWIVHVTGVQPVPLWQWTVAFVGTFLLLLPATAAMGATLPAMARVTLQLRSSGRSIAPLYASNTFGAVLGVLASAFWLVPELGLTHTAWVSAALNLACGLAALKLLPKLSEPATNTAARDAQQARKALGRLMLTGLLGIGYEVLVVRVLSQIAEDTVYTFAMLLAVYLVGTAIGAAAYERRRAGNHDPAARQDVLLAMLSVACLVGTASLWGADFVREIAGNAFGHGMTAAIGAEALLAVLAFGPPTIMMGAVFSHLCVNAASSGVGFARALGVNTLGAAAAPAVFGVLAFPLLGAKLALLLIAIAYLSLVSRRRWLTPLVGLSGAGLLLMLALAPRLAFIDIPDGGRVLSYQEGVMAAVSVVEDADGIARLRIDNRQQEGTSATRRVDGRQAVLPLLLHPSPKAALFLGLGTGVTASTAAEDPSLRVDAVELLPEVITASRLFMNASADGPANPRLHLLAADARRYVRASDERYDVIVSDNFHPARSGSGSLYTVEHFTAVRERLEPGGLFCQWLPLHQLDLATLRSIVQSFLTVYPGGMAMLANNSLETPVLGLVSHADALRFDVESLRARLAHLQPPNAAAGFGIDDEFAVLGNVIAGPEALKRFAGGTLANTDDHPVVAYRAPRVTYAPDSLPRDRLIELLHLLSITPEEVIAPMTDKGWSRRLAAYWTARDRFIETGRGVRPSSDVRQMLAQVRAPLLAVLRISPDFRPAYDPLLAMARGLARSDVDATRALLGELEQVQPARLEAALALRELDTSLP